MHEIERERLEGSNKKENENTMRIAVPDSPRIYEENKNTPPE